MSHNSNREPRVAVVLLAAGNGVRLGLGEPKAFIEISGRTILSHALEPIFNMREPVQIIVTVPPSYIPLAKEIARSTPGGSQSEVIAILGGHSRQASVHAALAQLSSSVEIVLIHDAARPLTPTRVFESVAAEVRSTGFGVIPGLPVTDTIKKTDEYGLILETVERSSLTSVQTPQGFPREHIEHAHSLTAHDFTDDAALVQEAGYKVAVLAGDEHAFKITTGGELRRAEQLVTNSQTLGLRVGTGMDVHQIDPDHPLWLAGLFWPDQAGLAGHSDGDVVCHAICDAMLAAAGLGDLGAMFGVDDPRLENAPGELFLRETLLLIHGEGFELGNVTVQLIGNHPKLGTRRKEAELLLSGILGSTVSITATTSDSLGFTGRGEGVAAIATALLHTKTPSDIRHTS